MEKSSPVDIGLEAPAVTVGLEGGGGASDNVGLENIC